MKTELIPKSRAKTAYALLSEVVSVVLAEPKRLHMSVPLSRCPEDRYQIAPEKIPECGTVGCVAGWAVVLKDVPVKASVTRTASALLGLDDDQSSELFFNWEEHYGDGTKELALSEARLIRRFQKKYRAQLLAKKV